MYKRYASRLWFRVNKIDLKKHIIITFKLKKIKKQDQKWNQRAIFLLTQLIYFKKLQLSLLLKIQTNFLFLYFPLCQSTLNFLMIPHLWLMNLNWMKFHNLIPCNGNLKKINLYQKLFKHFWTIPTLKESIIKIFLKMLTMKLKFSLNEFRGNNKQLSKVMKFKNFSLYK